MSPSELILLPSLSARAGPNGGLLLTQKYLDGAAAYARLILYTDFAQNSLKARRYDKLRANLRLKCARSARRGAGVYLRRGCTGELRLLENETEIENMLEHIGFDIIDPTTLTAPEIASRTLDAPLVMAVP